MKGEYRSGIGEGMGHTRAVYRTCIKIKMSGVRVCSDLAQTRGRAGRESTGRGGTSAPSMRTERSLSMRLRALTIS